MIDHVENALQDISSMVRTLRQLQEERVMDGTLRDDITYVADTVESCVNVIWEVPEHVWLVLVRTYDGESDGEIILAVDAFSSEIAAREFARAEAAKLGYYGENLIRIREEENLIQGMYELTGDRVQQLMQQWKEYGYSGDPPVENWLKERGGRTRWEIRKVEVK